MTPSLRDTIRESLERARDNAKADQDRDAEKGYYVPKLVCIKVEEVDALLAELDRLADMERLAFQAGEERREALENAEQAADEVGRLREAVNDAVAALAELEAEVWRLLRFSRDRKFIVQYGTGIKPFEAPRIAALLREAGRADGEGQDD